MHAACKCACHSRSSQAHAQAGGGERNGMPRQEGRRHSAVVVRCQHVSAVVDDAAAAAVGARAKDGGERGNVAISKPAARVTPSLWAGAREGGNARRIAPARKANRQRMERGRVRGTIRPCLWRETRRPPPLRKTHPSRSIDCSATECVGSNPRGPPPPHGAPKGVAGVCARVRQHCGDGGAAPPFGISMVSSSPIYITDSNSRTTRT